MDPTENNQDDFTKDSLVTGDEPENEPEDQEGQNKEEPEQKSEDSQADEDKDAGAPETYEDFVLPEGMEVDSKLLEEFTPIAKELNLTQDQAQKLVDLQAKAVKDASESSMKAWEDTRNEWKEASKSDAEFGGLKFDESIAAAKKALVTFGTDELKEALEVTGTGDHPEFIRFLVRVGKAVGEDKMHIGDAPQPPVDRAKRMFPNHA